jgi:hypothetical protein
MKNLKAKLTAWLDANESELFPIATLIMLIAIFGVLIFINTH